MYNIQVPVLSHFTDKVADNKLRHDLSCHIST